MLSDCVSGLPCAALPLAFMALGQSLAACPTPPQKRHSWGKFTILTKLLSQIRFHFLWVLGCGSIVIYIGFFILVFVVVVIVIII